MLRVFESVNNLLLTAGIATALLLATGLVDAQEGAIADNSVEAELAKRIETGRGVFETRRKGNCLSCHLVIGSELPGNAGPPLIGMQARWPDREALKAQIYDPTLRNPDTIMPPYGLHRMLTDEELDVLVDYVLSL
ncbi:MAG: sulfur oxidation c-type cytochrome SoxX [Xanthomonadales bacterium]|nr:sulfur oxidation c-type cytochrome SoxX [Xanthomonadales bacterium]